MERRKRLTIVASVVLAAVVLSSGLAQVLFANSAASTTMASEDLIIIGWSIPGWTFSGTFLKIGVNKGGTFITGGFSGIIGTAPWGVGFQFPKGDQYESLAFPVATTSGPPAGWVEGYSISYKTYKAKLRNWVDNIAYWWPGLGWGYYIGDIWVPGPPPESRLIYWKSSMVRNDTNRAIVQSFMNTTDGALTLKFTFSFQKHQAYVELRTDVYANKNVRDVLYKRIVDWDVYKIGTYQDKKNDWSSGPNFAYARESTPGSVMGANGIMSVTGYAYTTKEQLHSLPVYVDLYAWDDLKKREPGWLYPSYTVDLPQDMIQSPAGWISETAYRDYCAAIYYELDNIAIGASRTVYTVYQAAFDGNPSELG